MRDHDRGTHIAYLYAEQVHQSRPVEKGGKETILS